MSDKEDEHAQYEPPAADSHSDEEHQVPKRTKHGPDSMDSVGTKQESANRTGGERRNEDDKYTDKLKIQDEKNVEKETKNGDKKSASQKVQWGDKKDTDNETTNGDKKSEDKGMKIADEESSDKHGKGEKDVSSTAKKGNSSKEEKNEKQTTKEKSEATDHKSKKKDDKVIFCEQFIYIYFF